MINVTYRVFKIALKLKLLYSTVVDRMFKDKIKDI